MSARNQLGEVFLQPLPKANKTPPSKKRVLQLPEMKSKPPS